jgi:predicted nucleic acid-binding Zn ribbon protein
VGIVFKGSGFYATDNRSPSGASRNIKKTDGEEKSQTSESKSETKSTENKD